MPIRHAAFMPKVNTSLKLSAVRSEGVILLLPI